MVDVKAHIYRKFSKAEVDFEHPATGKDDCDNCVHWLGNADRCEIVAGVVKAEDWCKKFKQGKGPTEEEERE